MILENGFADDYLRDYRDGKIQMGLSLNIPSMDASFRFKPAQLVMINGIDGVGKTEVILWPRLPRSMK